MNESRAGCSAFAETWRTALRPEGPLENEAFDDYVRALWHKREVIAALAETPGYSAAVFLDDRAARRLDRLHRYERDFERRAALHLRELRRLQAERRAPAAATGKPEEPRMARRTTPPAPAPVVNLSGDLRASLIPAAPLAPNLNSGPPPGS